MQLASTSVILENCECLVIRNIHKTRPVKMYAASGDLQRRHCRSFISLWFASVLSPYLGLYSSFFLSFFLSFFASLFLFYFSGPHLMYIDPTNLVYICCNMK
jgi:hypothetical protein